MSTKQEVITDKAPQFPYPFSQAVTYNGMIYCSGSIGIDPATGKLVDGGVTERTVQTLKNLSAVLEAGNSSLENVVKVNVFLTDMKNFMAMNEGYASIMTMKPLPCRTCVAVREIPLNGDVEIECTAYLNA